MSSKGKRSFLSLITFSLWIRTYDRHFKARLFPPPSYLPLFSPPLEINCLLSGKLAVEPSFYLSLCPSLLRTERDFSFYYPLFDFPPSGSAQWKEEEPRRCRIPLSPHLPELAPLKAFFHDAFLDLSPLFLVTGKTSGTLPSLMTFEDWSAPSPPESLWRLPPAKEFPDRRSST